METTIHLTRKVFSCLGVITAFRMIETACITAMIETTSRMMYTVFAMVNTAFGMIETAYITTVNACIAHSISPSMFFLHID